MTSLSNDQYVALKDAEEVDPGARFVRERWHVGAKALRAEHTDYWLNWSFLQGHQWIFFMPHTQVLEEFPRDPDRVQATMNVMWPNSRTIISQLMQRELTFEATPKGADDAHIRGSHLAEAIVASIHDNHDWEIDREKLLYAIWKGGTAALSIDWDPEVGNVIAEDVEGRGTIRQGDVTTDILNITEFLVEPGARNAEKARWWIKAVAYPPEDVKSRFNLDKIPPADATAGLTPFQHKLLAVDRRDSEELIDLTLVFTYYERPNTECPEGKVLTIVDHTVVHDDTWPFPWKDRLNLVVGTETPKENRWTGETVLSAARPVQTAYNVSWSSIIEHMKLAGNARLSVPQSAVDLIDEFTDLPGEIIAYPDGTEQPRWLSPPQMPGWWIQQPEKLREVMDDIMGVHDISRGSAPANIESGLGLSILAEKDSTPIGRLTKETARMWGRLGSLALKLYEKHTPARTKRKSSIKNEDYVINVEWTGKDLHGQTDVHVPLDAVMPRSRAAQMEFAKNALQMGLIPEGDVVAFATLAEMPGRSDILSALSPDTQRARRENAGFAASAQQIPVPWDDHQLHINEHNKFRKTVQYEMLSAKDREAIEDHIQAHVTLAAEEAGRGRAAGAIDPALAEVANATGAPMVAPIEPPAPATGAGMQNTPGMPDIVPEGGGTADPASIQMAAEDVMSQLDALGLGF